MKLEENPSSWGGRRPTRWGLESGSLTLDGALELGLGCTAPGGSPHPCRGLEERILRSLWYCGSGVDVSKAALNLWMKLLAHPQAITPCPKVNSLCTRCCSCLRHAHSFASLVGTGSFRWLTKTKGTWKVDVRQGDTQPVPAPRVTSGVQNPQLSLGGVGVEW